MIMDNSFLSLLMTLDFKDTNRLLKDTSIDIVETKSLYNELSRNELQLGVQHTSLKGTYKTEEAVFAILQRAWGSFFHSGLCYMFN